MKYDKTDAFAGGLFILFGLIFGVQAMRLDMGTARDMGPGYFPVLLSAALVLFGAIVVYGAMKGAIHDIGPWALRGMAYILPALLVFGLTVRGLGFVPAVFLTSLVAGRATLDLSPARSLLLAVLVTAFSTFVFSYALGLPFRRFGPWLSFQGHPMDLLSNLGVECRGVRDRMLRPFGHDFGHLYSPVRRICAHPRGEVCARRSAGLSNPSRFRRVTA